MRKHALRRLVAAVAFVLGGRIHTSAGQKVRCTGDCRTAEKSPLMEQRMRAKLNHFANVDRALQGPDSASPGGAPLPLTPRRLDMNRAAAVEKGKIHKCVGGKAAGWYPCQVGAPPPAQ